MRDIIFLWSIRNEEHIATHDVAPEEAEYVIDAARKPYPQKIGDDKHLVWGKTRDGRFLQVIFVDVLIDDVERDEFQRLELYERMALEAGEPAIRVIHARGLTTGEKNQLKRRKRGRS